MSIPSPAAQHSSSSYPSSCAPGELVSALMDGQLRGPLLAQTVHDSSCDPQWLRRWDEYHLIGDAMRSPNAQGASFAAGSPDFLARLRRRLAEEAPQQAQVKAQASSVVRHAVVPAFFKALTGRESPSKQSGFQPVLLWQAVSACASTAALAAVAWHVLLPVADGPQWAQSAPQQLSDAKAQASSTALPVPDGLEIVDSPKGPMLREAQLQNLLAAHKQASGNLALATPAGFLRSATFAVSADASP